MTTSTLAPSSRETVRVNSSKQRKPVPAQYVQALLHEIVIAMHATRAIDEIERQDQADDTEE